jgi:glycosyltransferase involved in cell wall biosynthesis
VNSEGEATPSKSETVGRCLNVCVDHQPAHAGLFRGICDFAKALPGGILSFDCSDGLRSADPSAPAAKRVTCGTGWLQRGCHRLSPEAVLRANDVASDADLLVVHSLFRAHCTWANLWARGRRQPYWVVPHGCLDPVGFSRRGALKTLWMWRYGASLISESDAIVFATRREMAKAQAWIPAPQSRSPGTRHGRPRCVVIPWPVHLPSLGRVNVERDALRTTLRISPDARILLWVGRFHTLKRPKLAIRAFAEANPPGCHLVMVGVDETLTSADVRAMIPEPAIGRIHVLGERRGDELAAVWLAADGYLSLSAKENFGYTMADALAHGLPVILSAGHDLAHDLPGAGDGRFSYGWLLTDDEPLSAVRAIREWGDAAARAGAGANNLPGLGARSRSWVADQLSIDRFTDSIRRLAEAALCRAV